jgi:hypothetical protein
MSAASGSSTADAWHRWTNKANVAVKMLTMMGQYRSNGPPLPPNGEEWVISWSMMNLADRRHVSFENTYLLWERRGWEGVSDSDCKKAEDRRNQGGPGDVGKLTGCGMRSSGTSYGCGRNRNGRYNG